VYDRYVEGNGSLGVWSLLYIPLADQGRFWSNGSPSDIVTDPRGGEPGQGPLKGLSQQIEMSKMRRAFEY